MLGKLDNHLRFNELALNLRSTRQSVLASNIANADTPNYKARDIDFAAELRTAESSGGGNVPTAPMRALYREPVQQSLDGNTVEMDAERAQFADNTVRYEAALRFLNGQIKTLLEPHDRGSILVAAVFEAAPVVDITRESFDKLFAVNVAGVGPLAVLAPAPLVAQGDVLEVERLERLDQRPIAVAQLLDAARHHVDQHVRVLDHLQQSRGAQARVLLECRSHELAVRIQQMRSGAEARVGEARRIDSARDGVAVQAELGRDRADLPVLGEVEPADAGPNVFADHRATSSTTRRSRSRKLPRPSRRCRRRR